MEEEGWCVLNTWMLTFALAKDVLFSCLRGKAAPPWPVQAGWLLKQKQALPAFSESMGAFEVLAPGHVVELACSFS